MVQKIRELKLKGKNFFDPLKREYFLCFSSEKNVYISLFFKLLLLRTHSPTKIKVDGAVLLSVVVNASWDMFLKVPNISVLDCVLEIVQSNPL